MHISSLWGEYSCGSFGKQCIEFVDFLKSCGFSYWQVLPFCLPDFCNSPYSSFSAFSVNPNFIDLESLNMEKLITDEELATAVQESPYRCEFTRLRKERFDLLSKAASRFKDTDKIDEFMSNHPHTANFCKFMAIKINNDGKAFWEWDNETPDEKTENTWRFICYIFFKQWLSIKQYANSKGVLIIGDIPMYVSQDSSDVWESPESFLLNEQRRPLCVAGVPPDYFSLDGQLWGNPIYDWKHMEEDNFKWWRERVGFMCELFDGIRIDHFRGFSTYYTCPPDAKNARIGQWNVGPRMKIVNAIKEAAKDKILIAEDLGTLSDDVQELVEASGFPSMKVVQFANPDDPDNHHLPHNFNHNCVAYTGTHDNNTLLGNIWDLDESFRWRYLAYFGYEGSNWNCKESYYSVIRSVLACVADTVIFPIQDILLYGSDTRMNIPGKEDGNWEFRIKKSQLNSIDINKLKFYNKIYGR